jgi:hypothetical protein
LLNCSVIFAIVLNHFATILDHFMILSPIILNEYSAQSFLNEYSAQSFLNDYSAQLFCYNAQIFATMLGHLIILTAIRRCCSAQSFFGCYYAWGRSVIFQND